MKLSMKTLALMGAMAMGVAGADSLTPNTSTTAGTGITNTATATFTDPSTNQPIKDPVSSNTVITNVLPIYGFNVTYADGTTDTAATSVIGGTPTSYQKADAIPGTTVTFKYAVVNTGNAPETVTLSNPTGSVTNVAASTIKYYLSDPEAGTPSATTTVSVDPYKPNADGTIPANGTSGSGITFVWVQYTVPSLAAGTAAGITPVGTGPVGNGTLSGNTPVPPTSNTTETASTLYLQFNEITTYNPKLDNNVDQTPPATPPTNTTPDGGTPNYNGGTPPTTGGGTPPKGGTTPGTTPVVIGTDQQIAYPPADADTTGQNPDVVDFTNTIKNGGASNDVIKLTPTTSTVGTATITWSTPDANGMYTGTYTDPSTGQPATVYVQFLKPDGTPLGTTINPGLPVNAGESGNYITQVTYPDSNTVPNQSAITIGILATSTNNPNTTDTTTDIIMPPAAQFGDASTKTTSPLGVNNTPEQAQTNPAGQTQANPGDKVTYSMDVANTGTYPDSYNLSGYVLVPLNDGTYKVVPVNYGGTGVTDTGTTTSVSVVGPDGLTYTANNIPVYKTGTVAVGADAPVTASVTIPTDAAAVSGASAPQLQQTASSIYSATNGGSLVMVDQNDPLVIGATGGVVVGKFTNTGTSSPLVNTQNASGNPAEVKSGAPTGTQIGNPAGYDGLNATQYLPGVEYDYKIIGKNNYNSPVSNFALSDTLKPQLQYQSATCEIGTINASGNFTSVTNVGLAVEPTVGSAGTVTCNTGTLAYGQVEVLQIFVKIK